MDDPIIVNHNVFYSLEPKEELVKVMRLKYDGLVPGDNNTFGTTVRWDKPLFTHSEVKHYRYKVMSTSALPQRRKRTIQLNMAIETVSNRNRKYLL